MREEDVVIFRVRSALQCGSRVPGELCLGGSALLDPVVVECMEGQGHRSPATAAAAPLVPMASGSDANANEPTSPQLAEPSATAVAPGRPTAERLMRDVRLSSIAHLVRGSLRPLRAAIARTSEHEHPESWAAYHVILGCALRLRARHMRGSRRVRALSEAIYAFDMAFTVYASLHDAQTNVASPAHSGRARRAPCAGRPDGAALIARAISGRHGSNTALLERAVRLLRDARAVTADARSSDWISSTNNLACALTLLASRAQHTAACRLLEEAVDALHEVLRSPAAVHLTDERRCTFANLTEALLSMAARGTPFERMRHLESALQAAAQALTAVVPSAYTWLVQLEQLNLL